MDTVDKTPKLSLKDTEDQEETLEEALTVFGDIASKIEEGAGVKMYVSPDFYYSAAKEVSELKDRINELEIMLEGAKRGVERYVFGQIEITDEKGQVITVLDEWVSRQLIEGAVATYVVKAIVKGTENANK